MYATILLPPVMLPAGTKTYEISGYDEMLRSYSHEDFGIDSEGAEDSETEIHESSPGLSERLGRPLKRATSRRK